jgi:hypothetical protein
VRRALALLLATAVVPAAGCGNEPAEAPDVTTLPRITGWTGAAFPAAGISFERPREWHLQPGRPPLLGTITAGRATIAFWRYPRSEALPSTLPELTVAKDALLAAARGRDRTFHARLAKGTRAARRPAVVIVADETVAGQRRRVRSTHVYAHGGEVVVDAFAPPRDFARLEDPVFRRVVRTLRVQPPPR